MVGDALKVRYGEPGVKWPSARLFGVTTAWRNLLVVGNAFSSIVSDYGCIDESDVVVLRSRVQDLIDVIDKEFGDE